LGLPPIVYFLPAPVRNTNLMSKKEQANVHWTLHGGSMRQVL
jgi:hypothetical protein